MASAIDLYRPCAFFNSVLRYRFRNEKLQLKTMMGPSEGRDRADMEKTRELDGQRV